MKADFFVSSSQFYVRKNFIILGLATNFQKPFFVITNFKMKKEFLLDFFYVELFKMHLLLHFLINGAVKFSIYKKIEKTKKQNRFVFEIFCSENSDTIFDI